MEIIIVEPVDLTDAELAEALLYTCLLRYTGALTPWETRMVERIYWRIESLIAARIFVRRLLANVDNLTVA